MSLSIEERYDEVRQLITSGKEKGYLLFDEVNEILPSEIVSAEDLDELFNAFGTAGIEVVDSEQKYLGEKAVDRRSEGASDADNTAPPTGVDKTSDPVRMYLREMGTVPLLNREGEVEIAKRIERGKLAVVRSISRTPTNARIIVRLGEQLRSGERTIRELVVFKDEELSDNRIADRGRQILRQIDAVQAKCTEVEKHEDAAREEATQKVRAFFVLDKIAQDEKIFVTEGEVDVEFRNIGAANNASYEDAKKHYEDNKLVGDLRLSIMERKVRDFLRQNAKITDK